MLSKSKIFLLLCLSFILGVFVGRFISYEIMALMAMIFVILICVGWDNKKSIVMGAAGLVMLLGAVRFQTNFRQNDLMSYFDQKIQAQGTILEEPDVRPQKTFLTISEVILEDQRIDSKILLNTGRFPEYEYGQKIEFEGKLVEPNDAEEPGEFSYKNYLSRFGVDGIVYYPKIEIIENSRGNPIKYYLFKFKSYFVSNLSEIMPEPQNSFLAGLLVGLRKSIPEDLTDALAVTGTTHVIAISGFNITIIATAVNGLLLRFFRRKISFFIAVLSIVLFVVLAGASASAVRAGIMGGLGMLALRIGRINAIANAITFTAVIMLAINPQILHFDAGFQLSFLALIGLIYLTPLLDKKFSWVHEDIRIYITPTIAAYTFTLPFILHEFGRLSLVAIPANFLVLPMIPLAMLFGFIAGVLALISPVVAYPMSWLAWGSLTYVLEIVKWFAAIPYASTEVRLNTMWTSLCYLVLISMITYLWIRQRKAYSSI